MVNSRITRFAMEIAPPQFVSVIRHRTAKMLATISEEEKDARIASTPRSISPYCSAASSSSASAADSKYFLRGVHVQQSFSIFEN